MYARNFVWRCTAGGLLISSALCSAQSVPVTAATPQAALVFDSISVKGLAPGDHGMPPRVSTPGYPSGFSPGGLHFPGTSLASLIRDAYVVQLFQYNSLPPGFEKPYPDWVSQTYYSIDARTTRAATVDELRVMFRALLADRFQLQVRWVPVEMPAFTLELAPDGPPPADPTDATAISIDDFARFLSGTAFGAVVNRTGLHGKYINAVKGDQYCRAAIVGIVPIGALGRGPEPGTAPDCQGRPTLEELLESRYHLRLVRHDKLTVDTLRVVSVQRPEPEK